MAWAVAIVGGTLLAVAAVSQRLTSTPFTPAMAFVLVGLVAGPAVAGALTGSAASHTVRTLAEASLAIVLFSDAARINLRALRREYAVPLRLLAIGLPLTIVAGALAAAALLPALTFAEWLVLAIVLAPTDAALGQAVVTEPRLPSRVRQGLNVESGLNDGICVPLLLIALAAADVESHVTSAEHVFTIVGEQLGYGILSGVGAGLTGATVMVFCGRRKLITESWLQVVPVACAVFAYGVAVGLGGSGFIAAFLAGSVFGHLVPRESARAARLSEELGELLAGVTFMIFGAILLGPELQRLSASVFVYALLSLTVVRMVPVAIAMIASGARWRTVAFLGWFGPRGLASIVFAVIVVEEAQLPDAAAILAAAYVTIGLSVFAHGVSAAPLAARYARWYANHAPVGALMERGSAPDDRLRGAGARRSADPQTAQSSTAPVSHDG